MEEEDLIENYTSIISEFILIGINDISHAKSNQISLFLLVSLPNRTLDRGNLSRRNPFIFTK